LGIILPAESGLSSPPLRAGRFFARILLVPHHYTKRFDLLIEVAARQADLARRARHVEGELRQLLFQEGLLRPGLELLPLAELQQGEFALVAAAADIVGRSRRVIESPWT